MSTQGSPPVLITRPEPKAGALARHLTDLGISPVLSPLMAVAPLPGPPLSGAPVLAFSSANGVAAAAARGLDGAARAYVVGPDTARAAREAGLSDIRQGGGDIRSMADLIRADRAPRLTYVRGRQVSADLPALLAGATEIEEVIVYHMAAAKAFAPAAEAMLRQGGEGVVAFYSPRTARIFADLLKSMPEKRISAMIAVSISHETAKIPASLGFRESRVADRPEGAAMVRAILSCCGRV